MLKKTRNLELKSTLVDFYDINGRKWRGLFSGQIHHDTTLIIDPLNFQAVFFIKFFLIDPVTILLTKYCLQIQGVTISEYLFELPGVFKNLLIFLRELKNSLHSYLSSLSASGRRLLSNTLNKTEPH